MADYRFDIVLVQDEDGGYVVSCPALSGCATQGDTYEAAMTNIREVIELVIEDMRESGESIPQDARFEQIDIAV